MIRVLLFANLQEEAGRSELQIEKENITVAELKDIVATEYNVPVLAPIMVAINEEYANEDDTIQSGDVVALIPPVRVVNIGFIKTTFLYRESRFFMAVLRTLIYRTRREL